MNKFIHLFILLSISLLLKTSIACADTISLTTYYPAPFGVYTQLRLFPTAFSTSEACQIGTIRVDSNGEMWICNNNGMNIGTWGDGPGIGIWEQDGLNIYSKDTTASLGLGTKTPEFRLTLEPGGILAKGTFGIGEQLTTSGKGTRLLWYPRKAAFRAGTVTAGQWDDANIGNFSTAFGSNSVANGRHSTSIGNGTIASGVASFALGNSTVASGIASFALGTNTIASGNASLAFGINSQATGTASFASGLATVAAGQGSFALGNQTTADGDQSLSMGFSTTSSGLYSFSMGHSTTASGIASFSMGSQTTSIGYASTSMGFFTKAESALTIALGRFNVGGGNPNIWINTDPIFEIGNGTDAANRNNSFTIYKNGNTITRGTIQTKTQSIAPTCNAAAAGTIYFNSTNFFGCDGTIWKQLDN